MMYDLLKDLVLHTHALGLDMFRIDGTDQETKLFSVSDDRSVILSATFAEPNQDMVGTFGLAQLQKLKINLDCPVYKEDAKITIVKDTRDGETTPTGLHFENKEGDFKNDYRFMSNAIVKEKLQVVVMRPVNWNVELEPSMLSIQRFQYQTQSNSEHATFQTLTEGDDLVFLFGDQSSHGGKFIFHHGVSGNLKTLSYPVSRVLNILKIADTNKCKMGISNSGAMYITLDSGIAEYRYIIPAMSV